MVEKGVRTMERTMQTTRRYKRTRQPRRIVLLWLVCLFAAVSFGVLLAISPAAKALLRSEGGPAPAVAPVEGREMPGVIDAPFIDQRDKYPTGCESVTAVMALQYAGVDITVEEFIDNYLPQGNAPYTREDGTLVGADPWKVFLGSPYEESGWGCYAPVITGALEQLLQEADPDRMALLRETDVLVDGPFLLAQRSLELKYCGSRNQRLIDVKKTLSSGVPTLWEPPVW